VMDHVCFGNLAASEVRYHWKPELGPCTRRTNVPLCRSGSGLPGLELGLIMIIGARHVQPRAGPGRASHSELSLSLSRARLLRAQSQPQ
jgi:hypothetical protein